jgi:hypothetical protein
MNRSMKQLIFIPHSLDRMKERCISDEMVRAALNSPDNVDCTDEKRKIAQKFIKGKLLRIIFEEEDETIIVISAYSTSKISKYLRR